VPVLQFLLSREVDLVPIYIYRLAVLRPHLEVSVFEVPWVPVPQEPVFLRDPVPLEPVVLRVPVPLEPVVLRVPVPLEPVVLRVPVPLEPVVLRDPVPLEPVVLRVPVPLEPVVLRVPVPLEPVSLVVFRVLREARAVKVDSGVGVAIDYSWYSPGIDIINGTPAFYVPIRGIARSTVLLSPFCMVPAMPDRRLVPATLFQSCGGLE